MTYCHTMRAECPQRRRREDDHEGDWGCVHWWEFNVERTPQNGGTVKADVMRGCSLEPEIGLDLDIQLLRQNTKVPEEISAMRIEQLERIDMLRIEQQKALTIGLTAIANGVKGLLDEQFDRPKLIIK